MGGIAAKKIGRQRVKLVNGERPVATEILVARGSRLAKHREPTPKAFIGPPASQECPDELRTEDERAEWPGLCERLTQLGVYSDTDRRAMIRYCQLYPQYNIALRDVPVERAANFHTLHPSDMIFNRWLKLHDKLLSLDVQFGLTPQSRAGAMPNKQVADKPPHGNSKAGKAAKERFRRDAG